MATAMATETFQLRGDHVRGKRLIGVRGWESVDYSRELREWIYDTAWDVVDRRKIGRRAELGTVTVDSETGEVVDWEIKPEYLAEEDQ